MRFFFCWCGLMFVGLLFILGCMMVLCVSVCERFVMCVLCGMIFVLVCGVDVW